MSMTGRLPFWSDLIKYGFPERPILGYGFMSISDSPFTNKFDSIHAYAASMTQKVGRWNQMCHLPARTLYS